MTTKNSVSIINVKSGQSIVEAKKPSYDNQDGRNENIKEASYWNAFHVLSILATCCLNSALLFLIPRENSILYQALWYETIPYIIVGVSSRHSISHIVELYIFRMLLINLKSILDLKFLENYL